jgi:uncharacterized protein (TIGR03437 family)
VSVGPHDRVGRVTRVTAPDGSATTTSYQGNTTTVTDPAGKRKKFTYDAFGALTQVAEPDAQGNLTVLTNYTYDVPGRLTLVSMNGGAQTRQFVYNSYGEVASAAPLSLTTIPPVVSFGGIAASEVFFAGLAPGFVGLYQVNVRVPLDAPSGAVNLVIQTGGQSSNAVKLLLQ